MVNVKHLLNNYDVNTSSCSTAVASLREFIERHSEDQQIEVAESFFYDTFGLRVKFEDRILARLTAQYMINDVCKNQYDIGNAPRAYDEAALKALQFKDDPTNAWQFATASTASSFTTADSAPKEPKKNKGTASTELYNEHVRDATTPLTNIQFVELLVKELSMTKSGARTYAYNCFKAGKTAV